MKAIVYTEFGPPEVLQLKEVQKPNPRDGEVLIRIYATTVVKEDPDMRAAPGFNGIFKPRNRILGQELAGVVEATGRNVTRFSPGDAVYGMCMFGAYAEYLCMPATGALAPKPANMSYAEAASVPNGALTALHFLRDKGKLGQGQQALIYGASGSVGSAAVQLARHYGAEVSGVCSGANLEMVKSLGARMVFDYTREDFTLHAGTYDLIFDTVGKCLFARCKDALKKNGVFLTTVPSLQVLRPPLGEGRKIKFAAAGMQPAGKKAKDLLFLKELIEAGNFKAVIDRRYPLEQVAEAHRYVEQGHKKGNVVIAVVNDH